MRIHFDVPGKVLHDLLDPVQIPPMARVERRLQGPDELANVEQVLVDQLEAIAARTWPWQGQRIAVAVGSRGIGRLPEIVATLVGRLQTWGATPFIVPAMGSHGGATAEGQLEVLAHLGINQESVGAPVVSQMETVVVGTTNNGSQVHMDRTAFESDGIVFVARVKPHTAFRGPYESGLAKMIAIGLGKQAGAAATHARGFGSMAEMVPEMARVALEASPIRFGIAVLENAHDLPFKLAVVPADRILPEEPALLEKARAAMPRLPYDSIDVLIIDRIGKNISGDGADPNVTGRYPTPFASGGPSVSKQVVLDLADASAGNANGVGLADFTTVRLAGKMDLARTYPNALTSTVPGPVKLPMVLPSDRLAIAAAVLTCNAVDRAPRMVRIQDTLHLGSIWISEELTLAAEADPHQRLMRPFQAMPFDQNGNLTDLIDGREPALAASTLEDAW